MPYGMLNLGSLSAIVSALGLLPSLQPETTGSPLVVEARIGPPQLLAPVKYPDALTKGWPTKRLLLYAHGGLVSEGSAVQRIADDRTTRLEKHLSNAFESRPKLPLFRDGVPLLGMQRFADAARKKRPAMWAKVAHVLAPNAEPGGSIKRSAARADRCFDDDQPTLVSTLARILEVKKLEAAIEMTCIGSDLRVKRDRWAQA